LSSKPALGKQFLKPYLEKNPSQKVVEHLPSNCEALSSNPNTEKREREGQKSFELIFKYKFLIFLDMCYSGLSMSAPE
jgi:hypothetical protein